MRRVCGLAFCVLVLGLGAGVARGQCFFTNFQKTPDGRFADVTVRCDHVDRPGSTLSGCCGDSLNRGGGCSVPERACAYRVLEAWLEVEGQRQGMDLSFSGECGPCCEGECTVNGEWTVRGERTFRVPCDGRKHRFYLYEKRQSQGGGVTTVAVWNDAPPPCEALPPQSVCVSDPLNPHAGDGCCDPRENERPSDPDVCGGPPQCSTDADCGPGLKCCERLCVAPKPDGSCPSNINPRCVALFGAMGRACCRPANLLPPGGDPTHPSEGHPPLPGAWLHPGWCDQCSGGGGGGCRSDADCGPGQKCCGGACVEGTSCAPSPPSGFNVVIAVYGSEGHRWDARLKQGKVRVPMSFRLWDPAAGRYVYETTADGAAPCRNRRGKVLDPVLACWSRPWLVPDYDENPTGVVRTHRIHLDGPRTLYVQPECGVEFNAVLNPAKLRARFREPPITFDPERDLKLGLKLDMDASCSVRQNVCADGRPCGRCPNGRWPEMDGSCIGGGTLSGTACADGSACEAACLYVIDLTDVYERRETVSWCYEDTRKDRACGRPGDPSSCASTAANAVDDWRASSPFCWEQTVPNPPRGAPAQGIGRPASFKDPPNCTLETDGCWAFDDKTCGPAGARGSRRP